MNKKKPSPISAGNSSSDFSSGCAFILLPGPDGGLDGTLFYDRCTDMPL